MDYLLRVHKEAHLADVSLPTAAVFIDEVSLVADRYADASNPAVRLFTQGYQHRVIGTAITQRPALTSRHIIENAWEAYIFNPGPIGAETLESYGWRVPDWAWVSTPRSYRYWRYAGSGWLRGDAGGVEVEVSAVREPVEEPLPAEGPPGRTDDVGIDRVGGMPQVPERPPPEGGEGNT